MGILILGRLRIVLNYLAQFFRAASAGISTSFLILFLSEVMTIYMLATLIQLRTSLPPSFAVPSPQAPTDNAAVGEDQTPSPSLASRQDLTVPTPPLLATLPDFNIVFGALFGELHSAFVSLPLFADQEVDSHYTTHPDATFLLSAMATLLVRLFWARQENESILFGSGRD